jgi:hypothetical protein
VFLHIDLYRIGRRISLISLGNLEAHDAGHGQNEDDQDAHALGGTGNCRFFISPAEMLDSSLDVMQGFLDVIVDAVNKRALVDDQLVEMLVDG